MPSELTLTFDMYLKTNRAGHPLNEKDEELDTSNPDWVKDAVFVPVLAKAFQNENRPAPDPGDPNTAKAYHRDDKGWCKPGPDDAYDVDFRPRGHWPGSKFPNDVLYNASPIDTRSKK
jgi:hypothetical protein